MRSILSCLGLLALLAVWSAAQDVVARNAWVRLPLPSKSETAMYGVLENHTAQKRSVVGGTSDSAATVELHEMKMLHSGMYMAPVKEVKIPANGKASFTPESYHVMLFGLKSKLAVGDTVNVTLKLDDGSTVPIMATVRK